ncbi:MAG: hypothetical protein ACYC60_17195 [Thermoanaerobaculia bacterium]
MKLAVDAISKFGTLPIFVIAFLPNIPLACSADRTPPPILQGIFGGRGARLSASNGGAVLELPCAQARVGESILVGGDGRFSVAAVLRRRTGAPPGGDIQPPRDEMIQLEGRLRANTLELNVLWNEQESALFFLERGVAGHVPDCL